MTNYQLLETTYKEIFSTLHKKCNRLSTLRLLLAVGFLVCSYYALNAHAHVYQVGAVALAAAFVIVMRYHQKLSWLRLLNQTLADINTDEIAYQQHQKLPLGDGSEYNNTGHPYAFDLDILGKHSLYQHLNRTATYIGGKKLADLLLFLRTNNDINRNQAAITELSGLLDWRQKLLALAKITQDNQSVYQKLLRWASAKNAQSPRFIRMISYASPMVLMLVLLLAWWTDEAIYLKISTGLFFFHLFITATQLRQIKQEIVESEKIHEVLRHYGLMLHEIENQPFRCDRLHELQAKLTNENGRASTKINQLSALFSNLAGIQNPMGALLSNGFLLTHTHTLRALLDWKEAHATQLVQWLDIIGTFEALGSLANFAHNNPEFTYPTLNTEYLISFTELGHPLIAATHRVCNNISFDKANITILTGSNMSGKSTFLRTLGINMVLTGAGAPICATQANVHPLDILVSMRLSDSLADNESYFFAEVKRLKQIMDTLQSKVCFVLLDEILRGTNSDDKRNGTIEVIKKLVAKHAIGAVATHDIEVCKTTDEFPDKLSNRCFEVEIINNDLAFDYRLRNGVCKNRSATFLMKKMNVI